MFQSIKNSVLPTQWRVLRPTVNRRFVFLNVCLLLFVAIATVQAAPLFAPINDNLANAINITALPFSNTVLFANADTATSEPGEVVCETGSNKTWWYKLTPATSGNITIVAGSTAGGECDVTLGVYTGAAHPLTEVSCTDEDDGPAINGENETIAVTAGTTYYIKPNPYDGLGAGIDCQVQITGNVFPMAVGGVAELIKVDNQLATSQLGYGLLAALSVLGVAIIGAWQFRQR